MEEHVVHAAGAPVDPTERVELLLRDLRTRREGLSSREAERRLIAAGPNELRRHSRRNRARELAAQFTHPLALFLWAASVLALIAGIPALSGARTSFDAICSGGAPSRAAEPILSLP